MKTIITLGIVIILSACTPRTDTESTQGPQTILAILAHPDDEAAIGQVLARYAREGHNVHLALAADGRYGFEEHAGIPPGDYLAQIRMNESICACETLGIKAPIFIGAHDGFGLLNGMDEYFRQSDMIKQRVTEIIGELNPNAILTFGPDGDTGHPDHKGISDLVTEVILRNEGWYEKYPLYYVAWPQEKEVWIAQGSQTALNYVAPKYMNVHITYSVDDRDKTFKSLDCYKSQYTETDVSQWIDAELRDSTFTSYFRQFKTDTTIKNRF